MTITDLKVQEKAPEVAIPAIAGFHWLAREILRARQDSQRHLGKAITPPFGSLDTCGSRRYLREPHLLGEERKSQHYNTALPCLS